MIRLHVVAEGQTEETFVNRTLAPHLAQFEVYTTVHCVTTSRRRGRLHRGGLPSYARAKRDLELWMKNDRNTDARFSTFFDLYALPSGFPGFEEAQSQSDPYQRVKMLEAALATDLRDHRFVPYFQLHEFEALLLADPRQLESEFIDADEAIQNLIALAAGYKSPELIDDGIDTAPSKRIINEIPAYAGRKASVGPLVADLIGLATLRKSCPHFDAWVKRLESLSDA